MTCVQPCSLASRAFSVRADRADHGRADRARPLAGDETDAARGRVEQHHRLVRAWVGLAQQVAHGHALQHHRGGGLLVDAGRQLDQAVGSDQPLLRITAEHRRVRHTVARLQVGDAGADRLHRAGALHADHRRQARNLVVAGAVIGIYVVETHRTLAQAHLAGPRIADRNLVPLQRLRSPVGMDADCVRHGRSFLEPTRHRGSFRLDGATLAF